MADKIIYTDKESLVTSPLPDENKVTDTDMNEIKNVVNSNADELNLVAETGSNTNGTYIKFPSGIMICTKRVNLTDIIINTATGSSYVSSDLSLGNFAQEFSAVPTVSVTLTGTNYTGSVAYVNNITKTSAGVLQIIRPTTTTTGHYYANVVAIGTYSVGGE